MDVEKLLAPRLPEADVELSVGTVRVRGLNRDEVVSVRRATDAANMDGTRVLILERKLIAAAMVDPQMTEAQVGQWQRAAPAGELTAVTDKIQELSGMLEGAPKSGL